MKTAEFLGKAIEENLYDLEDRQRFHRTQKPLTIKKIIDYTLLKLISSVFLRKKRQTTVEIKYLHDIYLIVCMYPKCIKDS